MSLGEIFAEVGDPASTTDEVVKAFKEAYQEGDGLPNEEEGEALMKFVDEMEATEFLSGMVLSQSRDPGFVVALDTDGDVERSTNQVRRLDCRVGVVRDSTPRFLHICHFLFISRIVSSGSSLVSSHSFVCRARGCLTMTVATSIRMA